MNERLRALAGPLFALTMLIVAMFLLHRELKHYHWRDLEQSFHSIPPSAMALALSLTVLNYLVLPGYDWLATRILKLDVSLPRVGLVGVVGYAATHNFGTLLGGTPVRYRLYSAWGLSAIEIAKLIGVAGLSFWIGLCTLGAVVFSLSPLPLPARWDLPIETVRPLGFALAAVVVSYLAWTILGRSPARRKRWKLKPPVLRMALAQIAVGALDVTLAASVLYVLLPADVAPSFLHFLTVYSLAIVAVAFSQVPGGLVIFEVSVLALLGRDHLSVAGPLLAFRAIYYWLPLLAAVALFGVIEAAALRRHARRAVSQVGRWIPALAPRLMALGVFSAGAILLFSGATPAAAGRIALLKNVVPLSVLEASHFLASVVGVLLLILAHALLRRSDAAWVLSVCLLAAGIVLSLLKGFDYEEALLLAVMLAALAPARREFYRPAALLTRRFTLGWTSALLLVFVCALGLTLFSHRHETYGNELWWTFEFDRAAPRSLRALVGAAVAALAVGVARLLRPAPAIPDLPTPEELEVAAKIVSLSPRTTACLALLGDKHLLFDDARDAFVMFGVEGRSWVALGDPVGPEVEARELAWRFRELCDANGVWPVFYQAEPEQLPLYIDLGLGLIKIGEEALVPLDRFSLEGGARKNLRRTDKRVLEAGCEFAILSPAEVAAALPELRRISDAWLNEKTAAEKGFSLGFFEPDYLRRFPAAVVRREGQLLAFANVLEGAGKVELSVDVMRHLPDAPEGTMEFLFVETMLWGQREGYQWFNLGMAPLSGIDGERLGPLWNRVAALAYRHGEHFYNFQGLRQYKEKFDPEWRPKYLAAPGGWPLPVILTNVATLISGGLRRLVTK